MTLEDVLAKEEIREVVLKLARGTDRLDRELIVSCYHEGALDDHNEFRGPPEAFADWVLACRTSGALMRSGATKVENLFGSLQQQAFQDDL